MFCLRTKLDMMGVPEGSCCHFKESIPSQECVTEALFWSGPPKWWEEGILPLPPTYHFSNLKEQRGLAGKQHPLGPFYVRKMAQG